MPAPGRAAEARAPPNIALIKYWGKRDARLNTPLNASLSLTLSPESLCSVTRAEGAPCVGAGVGAIAGSSADADPDSRPALVSLQLDGPPGPPPPRLAEVAALLRARAPAPPERPAALASRNTFPSGCGLASSASGACAAVRCLDAYFDSGLDPFSLAALARYVSGSGARSQVPGAVLTVELGGPEAEALAARAGAAGELGRARALAASLRGTPLAGLLDWTAAPIPVHPRLRAALAGFVAVLDPRQKRAGSTQGMLALSALSGPEGPGEVSRMLQRRLEAVPGRIRAVAGALERGELGPMVAAAEEDWQEMHRLAEASLGFSYLSAASWAVYGAVRAWREAEAGAQAGASAGPGRVPQPAALVTFDAGPNPFVICLREARPALVALVSGLRGGGPGCRGDNVVEGEPRGVPGTAGAPEPSPAEPAAASAAGSPAAPGAPLAQRIIEFEFEW